MDIVTILRDLWHHRRLVAGAGLIALLAGAAVMYKLPSLQSRQHSVGVASAQILVDTPNSQVVGVAPKGTDTLGVSANLLATMMVDGAIKSSIAARAGVRPNQILGVTDAATTSSGSVPTPSAPTSRTAFVLTTQVLTNTAGATLPIVQINAQAPTSAGAARLAAAAITGLRDFLGSTAAKEQVPNADRLRVSGLGAPQGTTELRGPSDLVGFLVVLGVFLLGCAGILAVGALVRGWHAASSREHVGDDGWGIRPAPNGFFVDLIPEPEAAALGSAGREQAVDDHLLSAPSNGHADAIHLLDALPGQQPDDDHLLPREVDHTTGELLLDGLITRLERK